MANTDPEKRSRGEGDRVERSQMELFDVYLDAEVEALMSFLLGAS